MVARDTSIISYETHRMDGSVTRQQEEILRAMFEHGPNTARSLREIVKITNIPDVSTISGRVNELKKLGLVIECETRKCTVTGRTIHPVRLNPAMIKRRPVKAMPRRDRES